MGDLFSSTEHSSPEIKQQPTPTKKKRGKYHDLRGKFTDKTTAQIAEIEKQSDINRRNSAYWKRQAERLVAEYNAEHAKVLELKELLKEHNIVVP